MNTYFTITKLLPPALRVPLCGKQEYAKNVQLRNEQDPCWQEWQSTYMQFYTDTQKSGVGSTVNNAGYGVLADTDLTGKKILEIGPGSLPHMKYWKQKPQQFDIADISQNMLTISYAKLTQEGISSTQFLMQDPALPVEDASYDIIVSFYSLEHLFPLENYIEEFKRILKPGGLLVGAIPTEGGLTWGLGRYMTSRRYVRKHFSFDFDKITAWEHCNTAEKILKSLDANFKKMKYSFWPLHIPLIDINLIIKFIYQR